MIHIPAGRRASIIHGYGAAPDDHWFPWLSERLEDAGFSVQVPVLPNPGAPDPERWTAAAGKAVGVPGQDSAVVAHSLGCITVLRHLLTLPGPWRLGSLILVSGFVDRLPALPVLDWYIGDGLDPGGVLNHVERVVVIRSDADPYVPVGHTDRLARLLRTEALIVPGAGHFLASDGLTSLPQALDGLLGDGLLRGRPR